MVNKKEIVELFHEKPKFREHSIYFYKSPRTVSEVKGLSGVERSTIYNHFSKFKENEHYDPDYLRVLGGGQGTPYQFTNKLIVDWFSEVADLDYTETKWFRELLEEEKVSSHLREKADSWENLCSRLAISWKPCLYLHEKGDLEEMISLMKIVVNGNQSFEAKEMEDMFNFVKESVDDFSGLLSDHYFLAPYISENPEMAEKIFKKLKKADFPFENPFKQFNEYGDFMNMMMDSPLMEMMEETITNSTEND